MKKQQIIFKGSGRITTAAFIKNKNMRYGQIRFKGGGRINNVRITGLTEEGGGGEDPIYKDDECLGFTAVDGDVTVSLQNSGIDAPPIVYYKREEQDWTLWNYSELNIAEGETIRFYGNNNFKFNSAYRTSQFIMSGTGKIIASGSCNSLLSKEKTKVLTQSCFSSLFNNCQNLISAPELPATTLAPFCYDSMFMGCDNLITAPELPATQLDQSCYIKMFKNCYSLVNAPVLPAINLVPYCYQNMFQRCTNLNYIKAMFTTVPSSTYTSYWVEAVAATGTFVKNSQATWDVSGVNGVPDGWTIETADE